MSEIDPVLIEKAECVYAEAFGSGASSQGQLVGHIARALQDERDGGWQDIATIPRNAGWVLAWDAELKCVFMASAGTDGIVHDEKWDLVSTATHWMPLPRPPHSKDSEG